MVQRATRVAGAAVALMVVPAMFAGAAGKGSKTDRATGGGQILVGSRGAGDTIAFTAQGTEAAGKGQVQVIDRTGGTGQGQVKFHGTVICLNVAGNSAKLAGFTRDGGTFTLFVVDNGEGANSDRDLITLDRQSDPTCEFNDDDEDNAVELARGNAQVYDAP